MVGVAAVLVYLALLATAASKAGRALADAAIPSDATLGLVIGVGAVLILGALASTLLVDVWKWLLLRRHPVVAEHWRRGWTIHWQRRAEG
ncbi:hypothetical protein GCM10009687_73630 [Asanoa iriomotensis]|uniref:Uncharacterized protein n=1 Tax=Asanoa iriomotensis TaxID=234613 RepID=A0ABQ4BX84_9ACTN|nr:hypothetical protein Air01nite_08710 [Asanoa iriomotensis]